MNELKTNWKKDLKAEEEIGEFLDEFFYPKCYKGRAKRRKDIENQNSGVDVIIDDKIVIDEKAASDYCKDDIKDKSLPTFILELYFKKDGEAKDGWFIGEKYNRTDYYLLMWIWAKDKEAKKDKIFKIEAVLVKKQKIIEMFNELGFPKERLFKIVSDYLEKKPLHLPELKKLGITVKQSDKKAEKPINLVVPKVIYKNLCEKFFIITRTKVICGEIDSITKKVKKTIYN